MITVTKTGKATCIHEGTGGYLISTSVNVPHPEIGDDSSTDSSIAEHMLKEKQDDITLDYFVSILEAIHKESKSTNTIFSYGVDLNTGDIHVIYFHQFHEVYKTIPILFSQKTKNQKMRH
jgi:hypothetical protein